MVDASGEVGEAFTGLDFELGGGVFDLFLFGYIVGVGFLVAGRRGGCGGGGGARHGLLFGRLLADAIVEAVSLSFAGLLEVHHSGKGAGRVIGCIGGCGIALSLGVDLGLWSRGAALQLDFFRFLVGGQRFGDFGGREIVAATRSVTVTDRHEWGNDILLLIVLALPFVLVRHVDVLVCFAMDAQKFLEVMYIRPSSPHISIFTC